MRGIVFNIFIGKVYHQIYGRKFSFIVMCKYDYPYFNAILQFCLKLEHCKPHKEAHYPMKCGIIIDVKRFVTVYRRIYCLRFLKLSNQTSCYKSQCIRIFFLPSFCLTWIYLVNSDHDIRSQLIRIHTVFNSACKSMVIIKPNWLETRNAKYV